MSQILAQRLIKKPTRTKEQIIDCLLSNSVYSPEGSLILRLAKSLSKLSASDLANLELIQAIRIDDHLSDKD